MVTKLPGYGLPRLNELFWNEHVLCSEHTDHLFNNSRVLLSGIKLRCQSWILLILKTRTFCSLWLFGSFSFLPPILQALSLQCLRDQPVASSFWSAQPEPNHSSSQERGIRARPELLWPDFCPTGGGTLNTSEFETAESVAICCVTTEQNPGRKME